MPLTSHAGPQPTPSKPLSRIEQKLLDGIWNRIELRIMAALDAAKTKLLDALEGQPLVVIGSAVGALDLYLLRGPKPMPDGARSILVTLRAFAADKLPVAIDKFLAPPKPISANLRKTLAGVVTLAGALGLWKRVTPVERKS